MRADRDPEELIAELETRIDHLETALASRTVIDVAKGIISERFQLGPVMAFETMLSAARSHHIYMRDLARRICTEKDTPEEILNALARDGGFPGYELDQLIEKLEHEQAEIERRKRGSRR